MDEKEALINKVIMCAEYYKKMGFIRYKEIQLKEFLRRMEDMRSQGVTIEDYKIDAIYYMRNTDGDKGCWDIDFKVKCSNQEIGWITLRTSNGAILAICDKWDKNMLQSNLYLPEDVDNFYTYTYTGENERWNAELKVIEIIKFTKTDSGLDVQTETNNLLFLSCKGELNDLFPVKNIEISYECNNENHKSVLDIKENNSSNQFTLNSVNKNGALYNGDEKIPVTILEKGEYMQTLDTTEIDEANQGNVTTGIIGVMSNLELRSKN
jgi:hypothetical protein